MVYLEFSVRSKESRGTESKSNKYAAPHMTRLTTQRKMDISWKQNHPTGVNSH